MQKTKNRGFSIFAILFYAVGVVLMILGTKYDLTVSKSLFNPENSFAKIAESFGQFVYWGMWGPAFTVIFLCRRNLGESLSVIGKLIPAVKPVENTESGAYKFFDFVLCAITTVGFFVLSGIGWKKLIENVTKNILLDLNKDNLSQAVYYIISFAVAATVIFIFRKADKTKLRKLEGLALAGVLLGIFFKITEECKTITERVRFREMVAYSNGFLNEKGMSEGKYSPLNAAMANGSDFSAFTNWFTKGDDMGKYSRADSFPSGHTTYACTAFLMYLFAVSFEKLKKFAPAALLVGAVYTAVMGYTRIVAGAHYLTDVTAAALLGFTFFVLVRGIYISFVKKGVIGVKD